eukprot:366124-Chlamydomonas_euryale.AAC.10
MKCLCYAAQHCDHVDRHSLRSHLCSKQRALPKVVALAEPGERHAVIDDLCSATLDEEEVIAGRIFVEDCALCGKINL